MMKRQNIMTVMIIKTNDSKTIMIKGIKITMTLTLTISMTMNMINAMTKTKFKMTMKMTIEMTTMIKIISTNKYEW